MLTPKQRKKVLEEFVYHLDWHTLEDLEDLANFEETLSLTLTKKEIRSIKNEAINIIEQQKD